MFSRITFKNSKIDNNNSNRVVIKYLKLQKCLVSTYFMMNACYHGQKNIIVVQHADMNYQQMIKITKIERDSDYKLDSNKIIKIQFAIIKHSNKQFNKYNIQKEVQDMRDLANQIIT